MIAAVFLAGCRRDQSVSRLIKSTGISERDESPEPFIPASAHAALQPELSCFAALISELSESFAAVFLRRAG